jgi:hypothetical protein
MNFSRYGATAGRTFIAKTRVWILPDAAIDTARQRADHAKHWRERLANAEIEMKGVDIRDVAPDDVADYRRMSDFANKTAEILKLVHDTLRPTSFDGFVKHGLD